ncbi:AMP-dependent synthetase [Sinomonas atrocyanea]|uniref:AMP-dependent synthetase n=1 Tax=Sinomonas atrocyanea TaxID=37927 RepID=A0A127A609_9MICC|nr:AMP-binding protein [Sinomonas atrocyanea]AMM34361.1 AMP-dependent synthetase [Sinomonas atrocyanea]GEB64557.1 4-coumarate--CoA ligase [Sinomonas atrocyanea]GGG68522.1 4-coumarate--CoA ligase [Sinomonas atrocyanea]
MFASPYPDVEIPEVPLHEYLFGGLAEEDLDRVAMVDGTSGAETTYRELVARIDALAGWLAAHGVGPGTTLGLMCPNVPAFAVVFHGILRTGAAVTTVNSLYTAEETGRQLADAGATWLFTVSPFLDRAEPAAGEAGIPPERVVVLDGGPSPSGAAHPSLGEALSAGLHAPDVEVDPHAVAVLPYSSGTSGTPKGVMLSHYNLVANVAQGRPLLGVTAQDTLLAVLPFFHIYGLTMLVNAAFLQRARLVTMPKFDLAEFLRITQDHRCTYLFIAPPIAVALAKHPLVEQYDLSSVRVAFSGAAPLDAALGEGVAARLGCAMLQGYGMTELSPASHIMPLSEAGRMPLDSVGVTVPNTQCKLLDPATDEEIPLPPAEKGPEAVSAPGQLLVRGPQVMLGYLNRPDATAATIDPDGFLRTGDIATVRADGVVTIVDRLKELIKYKGYQIAPAELEAVLLTHPQIADAAVIGVRADDGEEVPKAFVVRQPGAQLGDEDVMAFVAEHVAPFKKVRAVEFLDAIPKSSSGKILRRELRAAERG